MGKDELYVFEKTSQHPNFVGTYCVVKKVHLKKHGIVMEKCGKLLVDQGFQYVWRKQVHLRK